MYKLKQIPEDFFVREIPGYELSEEGDYSIFLLEKKNYTTERAIQAICNNLNIRRTKIAYAGNKDKHAVTEQYISIERLKHKLDDYELKDLKLTFMGFSKEPLSLGHLKGNYFEIVIRNLEKNTSIKHLDLIPNCFDQQRFSNNNVNIGRCILKKDFKKAVSEILLNNGDYEQKTKEHLKKNMNDYVGALRKIPKKILLLFIHAYQSFIFNKTITKYLELNIMDNEKIPIVGFGTDYTNDKIEQIVQEILEEENISERDFIIPSLPDLSCEGNDRDLFIELKDLKVGTMVEDDLNKGMFKVNVSFNLPKGSYATYVIKELLTRKL